MDVILVDYFEILLAFMKNNKGKVFESPRKIFKHGRPPQNFKIIDINESKIKIKIKIKIQFESKTVLPIEYWRLKKSISFIDNNDFVPIGASVSENYQINSLEGRLKEKAKNDSKKSTDTKTAPHIADLLVLSGIAEFGKANSINGREVQGIRLKPNTC